MTDIFDLEPGSPRSQWLSAEGFAFDLDGTLICNGAATEGAARLLGTVRGHFVVVSNNSSDTARGLSRKLSRLGLQVPPEALVLAGEAAVRSIAENWPGARVMILAAPVLQRLARRLGLRPVAERPDLVLLARDPRFTYRKLSAAANALRAGARLVVANPDYAHPGGGGTVIPETGALLQALTSASGVQPADVIGKPEPTLLREAARRLGLPLGRILMIGDNPWTDGVGAARLGMPCLLLGGCEDAVAATPGKLLDLLSASSNREPNLEAASDAFDR